MNSSSNKRIAKNTLFLYVRMFLTLGVSLYTSRVVLNTLGVEDFGIYNLVGGVVVLFSFINGSMTTATQRFLNFEMGKANLDGIHKVFCISTNVYFFISFIIVLLAETIGLWFLNNKLNIPIDRMNAANIVYQFSILAFVVNILKIPYNASIIAYEKMSFYAWVSIVEVTLKLIIVFALVYFIFDKLILYSILTFGVSVLIYLIFRIYCRNKFSSCRYHYMKDNKLTKKLLSFSGWSMIGNVAVVGSNQGLSMIMNMFLGVTINAAMGVANQVNTAVYGFVSNFQMAFNPQIVKTYASESFDAHKNLIYQTSKLSYFLLLIIAVPILFNTKYILTVWLKVVPSYSAVFTQLIILLSLLDALSGPFWMSTNAMGKIKYYQIGVSFLMLLNLPLAYFILHYGFTPEYVFAGKLVLSFIIYLFRVIYVKSFLNFTFKDFFSNVILRIILTTVFIVGIMFIFKNQILPKEDSILNLFVFTLISLFTSLLGVTALGINKIEKKLVMSFIIKRIKKQNEL